MYGYLCISKCLKTFSCKFRCIDIQIVEIPHSDFHFRIIFTIYAKSNICLTYLTNHCIILCKWESSLIWFQYFLLFIYFYNLYFISFNIASNIQMLSLPHLLGILVPWHVICMSSYVIPYHVLLHNFHTALLVYAFLSSKCSNIPTHLRIKRTIFF